MNTFVLTPPPEVFLLGAMNAKIRWCWRKDLAEFRGLTDRERSGFLLVLEWFENFRLRRQLEAGEEAARAFWKHEVLRDGRPREAWQLEEWEHAVRWYLDWLAACAEAGADHRSLPERVRAAVRSAGGRRGLARRTKQCYGAWAARYAAFANDERDVMDEKTATRFLNAVVEDEDCAYSTQKQALNAVAFFFKHVCGVENPVFDVKLRKTGTRIPVVLAQCETQRLFEALDARPGRVVLAVSGPPGVGGSGVRGAAAASHARPGLQPGHQAGRGGGGDRQARHKPLFAPQFCHRSPRSRHGLAEDPGIAGS